MIWAICMLSCSFQSNSLWAHGGISRQEYWSELPGPPPGNLPNQGLNLGLPHCRWILYCLSHQGSWMKFIFYKKKKKGKTQKIFAMSWAPQSLFQWVPASISSEEGNNSFLSRADPANPTILLFPSFCQIEGKRKATCPLDTEGSLLGFYSLEKLAADLRVLGGPHNSQGWPRVWHSRQEGS